MKVLAQVLAEGAAFHDDGSFTVFRGGFTDLLARQFPATQRCYVLTRLELEYAEANRLQEMTLTVSQAGAALLPEIHQPIVGRPTEGDVSFVNVVTQLLFAIPRPGDVLIQGKVGSRRLPTLRLRAKGMDELPDGDGSH